MDDLPDGGQPNEPGQEDFVGRQVRMTENTLGLNPDCGFNKDDLKISFRTLELQLHPDAAVKNSAKIKEATDMFQLLENTRDHFMIICKRGWQLPFSLP